MQQQGKNFFNNLMNIKKTVMIKYLYNDQNTQTEKEISLHGELYKEFKKYLNKKEIVIFINGKVCLRKDKLENYMSEKQSSQSLEVIVYSFEQLATEMNQKKYLIEFLNKEKNDLEQANSHLQNQVNYLKDQLESMSLQQNQKHIAELVTSSIEYTDNHTLLMKQKQVQYYYDVLKSKYEIKLSKLSSQSQNCISPIISTQLAQCHFCSQSKHDNFILLSCSHYYHQECLENLIEAQLTDKQPRLKCLCGIKISKQTLNQSDQLFAGKSLLELNVIELEEIKKNNKYKFVKCRNRLCHFFYIQIGQFNSYCPLCFQ